MAAHGVLSNRTRARNALKRGGGALEFSFDPDSDSHEMFFADTHVESDPELRLELAEHQKRVVAAVTRLPKKMRMALILRVLHGRSYKQIAEALGVKPESVKSYLFQARWRIRRELSPDDSVPG